MELIRKLFADKSRIAILSVCLLMLSVVMVSALTGETMALQDGEVCYQCSSDASKFAIGTSSSMPAASECSAGWHVTDDSNCEGSSSVMVSAFFNSNGGSPSTYNSKSCTINSGNSTCTVYINDLRPTRTGYNFDGWGTSSTCSDGYFSELWLSKSTTYYACWSKQTYTVTFNVNGGDGTTMSTKSVSYGGTYGELPTAYRTGYDFLGWYTSASGGTKVSSSTSITNSNHTLYAQWKAQIYTATFNTNGGTLTSMSSTKSVTYGGTYGELPQAVRTGWTFIGWYTAASGGKKVESTTKVTNTSDHTLYAHWSSITVTFDTNGGTLTSMSPTRSVTYGGTYGELPTASRTGYHFLGWYTSTDYDTAIKIESTTKVTETSNHTLYAIWGKLKVTLDANGGVAEDWDGNTGEKVVVYAEYGKRYYLTTPYRDGYNFVGWYTAENGGTKVDDTTKVTATSDHTLYAHWSNYLTIKFDVNGGNGLNMTTKSVECGGTYGELPQAYRTGYIFKGWNTLESGRGSMVTSGTEVVYDYNHTLYAIWEPLSYNVNLVINGGSVSYTSFDVTYDGTYVGLPTPNWPGHTFKGWNTKEDGSGTTITTSTRVTATSNHTLYAIWTFKVTLILKGGNVSHTTFDVIYGGTYAGLPTPNWPGYTFKGWNTKEDGSGTTITTSTKVTTKSDQTLYAQWVENSSTGDANVPVTYTINYFANGGTGAPSSQTKTKDKTLTLRTGVPTKYGYKFLGWSKFSTATSATYQPGDTYTGNASMTLYAVWETNKYTVTYNANGGTGTMVNSDYTYGVSKELSVNTFTKEGYTFKCWNTKVDGTGINYTDKQSITISEDLTLYAQWKSNDSSTGNTGENEITYIVRYNANGGTGTMEDDEHVYNFAKSLTKNTFIRTGYKFNGWNTKADGTGISYADGETVGNLTSTKGKVVTLYAQWVLNIISGEDGGNEGSGENNKYPTVSLTLDKAYETKLDLAVNVGNIMDSDNALAEIYLIPMEGTGFETGSSYVIDTIKNCKNGKNISTITDLKSDTKYSFQVVLLTENGSILGDEYVTFKTESKKSIIENIIESPQTGMLATILVSLICVSALGGIVFYRKKANVIFK